MGVCCSIAKRDRMECVWCAGHWQSDVAASELGVDVLGRGWRCDAERGMTFEA